MHKTIEVDVCNIYVYLIHIIMTSKIEPNFKEGSQYYHIYNFILTHPGQSTYTITKELKDKIHKSETEVSIRCSNLAKRGFLKKKSVSFMIAKGQYVTENRWYTTEVAPEDAVGGGMEQHLYRPPVSKTVQKRYEINCFEVEYLVRTFNRKVFCGDDTGCARDLAKHYLKIIDSIYNTVFQIDVEITIRMTYRPVLNTLED